MFGRSKHKKGLKLDFTCLACGREFSQTVETLLYDLNTMDRKRRGEQTKYDEYVIPERIVCPRCHAVDQFELSGTTYLKLGEVEVTALAITASARAPREGKPVRSTRGASRKKKKRRSR